MSSFITNFDSFSEISAMLNWDIYHDLVEEMIITSNDNPEHTARFSLSGKQSLDLLKNFISKVDSIRLHYLTDYDNNSRPRYSSNAAELEWVSL